VPFKSLQSCLPALSDALKVNRTTLYERQRALVRERLLVALPGHGRGSGVRATPESVAMLTIGMLASVNLADVGPLARSFSEAGSITSKCPLTGAKTFHAALSRLFSDETLARRVNAVSVQVNSERAAIGFDGSDADQDMNLVALRSTLERGGAKKIRIRPEPTSSIFSTQKHEGIGLRVSVSIPHQTVHDLTAVARTLLADGVEQ
jgi:hypothetical protein